MRSGIDSISLTKGNGRFLDVERQRERTVASSLISTIAPTREGIPAGTGIPVKLWPRL